MQLPNVENLEQYRLIYHRDDVWRPVIEAICRRYSLLDKPFERGPDGTHIVYLIGQKYVVKLFVPLFAQDFVAEHLVANHLVGKIGVRIPEIVAEGQIGGWNYLIMTRISGIPLETIWDDLPPTNCLQIATEVGQMIAQIRTVSVKGLEVLKMDWRTFLADQAADISAYQPPLLELAWEPAQEIAELFASLTELFEENFEPVLLLADITREHVFVDWRDGQWQMVGYVDFGDAMVGHPDYELIAPGLEIAGGDPIVLRTLLLAAGYSETRLNQVFGRRLMAYTLLHRFVDLASVLSAVPQARTAESLDELAQLIWPLPPST